MEDYKHKDHSCVCDKVREINEAQKKVARKKRGCDVSCERSIKELLNHCKHSDNDTIPFKLLCGCIGECETFVGTGVVNINGCFFDIRSSFFRVVDFVKGSDCCVILELLCPERCEKNHGIQGFVATGACFEVDLNDFTGITCFPPVAVKKMDPHRLLNGGYKKKAR
ncbi:CotY/CotZ family spore coat protein [Mesobacillus subterraneus]|nr:CotY/CotZ family spore coat protein [Mesobacillus subterraneus]